MGMYDIIMVPCPGCGEKYPAQSKSGPCELTEYELDEAPQDVLENVNRHAPFKCQKCKRVFSVRLIRLPTIPVVQ